MDGDRVEQAVFQDLSWFAPAALDGVCVGCRKPLPRERCGSGVFERDCRGGLVEVERA